MSPMNLAPINLATLLLLCIGAGCSSEGPGEVVQRVTLPTGEVLTEKVFPKQWGDEFPRQRLYFQESASAPPEIIRDMGLGKESPLLFRSGDHIALVFGSHYILQRWNGRDGPYWVKHNTNPDLTASIFLRTFLKPGDPRIGDPNEGSSPWWSGVPKPEVPFAFDHIDLDKNVLVTRRESSDTLFPQFLVYSATEYKLWWCFDLERTRAANGLTAPPAPNLVMEFAVVTWPGDLEHSRNKSKEDFLTIPGAEELFAQSVPLTSDTWRGIDCSFTLPTGDVGKKRLEARFGLADPWPHHFSIFLRYGPTGYYWWNFLQADNWVSDAIGEHKGPKGTYCRTTFYRVRER